MKTNKTFAELEAEINLKNHTGIDDFNGLSPFQMHNMIYAPLSSSCVVQLQKMKIEEYDKIPIIRLMKVIIDEINPEDGLRLTTVGNIPPKIVKSIYENSEYKEDAIESGIVRINKEDDCEAVVTAREILILCGMVKVRNKVMNRTKKCHELLNDPDTMLKKIWEEFVSRFNVSYFDGYPENECGKFGFAYILFLLNKYGAKYESVDFYGRLYLKAFPHIVDEFDGRFRSKEDEAIGCFSIRMLCRFFQYFGIVQIEERYKTDLTKVKITSLFNQMIKIDGT